ncbi:BREX-1 system adenine-specific DNA-methyltransferase PglX [Moraxellaceae bacterium AER2_44_116]|nr:BREX-1 system adenine-specific DNA-methyltransferase PglX [Moraxellaceae bacterium AER2_44_116]
METTVLKRFAQAARRTLTEQVAARVNLVLMPQSAARREAPQALAELEKEIKEHGQHAIIEKVAYTWFNRFCALRFMDVNGYNSIRMVSPLDEQTQPEILAEAKMGHIDERIVSQQAVQQKIYALLEGRLPSHTPEQEAYRLLLVAACNYWQPAMPFMFERIADYTELLMPDDLLSSNSILTATREAMTAEACQDVEVIGWLYQFYISEKKDQVFDALKKNKKIEASDIPAATQLFTPHWIVRYLVENSLGRLWLLNHPQSKLAEKMPYYIAPTQPETDFLVVTLPEELKVCDPACGSGHMLTYAFDLLYAIYEEALYEPSQIPSLILSHNLYGIEIDERAAALAAFALTMKARAKQSRFLAKATKTLPNICHLQPVTFEPRELEQYMDLQGKALFTDEIKTLFTQFEEADNFGSLIRPVVLKDTVLRTTLQQNGVDGHLLLEHVHEDVLRVLEQAEYLQQRYQVVVANPPYMGGKGMNGRMAAFLKDEYADVKSDLFSAFMVRNTTLTMPKGEMGFVTPYVWMFISSYEKLREFILTNTTITSLIQLEYNAFAPACIPVSTFTVKNVSDSNFKGGYVRLSDFKGSENQAPKTLEAIKNPNCGWFHRACALDFKSIPNSPIAYWVSEKVLRIYKNDAFLGGQIVASEGIKTSDNNKYLRYWFEPNQKDTNIIDGDKWHIHHKGGSFRKWFGNLEFVVYWDGDGEEIRSLPNSGIQGAKIFEVDGFTWSDITSSVFSARLKPKGHKFDSVSPSGFVIDKTLHKSSLLYLNSSIIKYLSPILNPTLHFKVGNLRSFPFLSKVDDYYFDSLIHLSKSDWNSYETSWDFTTLPLLQSNYHQPTIQATYSQLRSHWQTITHQMKELEEENNRIFIEAYGLQDELTPDVPLKEITLTCNPHYRYGGDKTTSELEEKLLTDTIKEFISYAVGCMFGRYSLDKEGLVLANQGQTLADYLQQITQPRFMPDEDNVIPILDKDWFSDDITERFKEFLKVSFGKDSFEENINFIQEALGKKGKAQTIRDYFLKDFYNDHVRRYKKRPIYWLFSSPKGSFNALIYVHRYQTDTVSVVLNSYLREFRTKLVGHKAHLEQLSISDSASQSDKTKAVKDLEALKKVLTELDDYESDILYPLATQQIAIDLDDGVKVNYGKLGAALKKIVGLDTGDD